jgi:hypothetical protein
MKLIVDIIPQDTGCLQILLLFNFLWPIEPMTFMQTYDVGATLAPKNIVFEVL